MTFNVSWVYSAINKYSPTAKKIAADSAKISKETRKAAEGIAKKGTALRKLKASLITARRKMRAFRKETNLNKKATEGLTGKFKQFAAFAIAGLGIGAIIREGAAFQDSMANLSAITGSGGKALQKFKSEIKSLSVEARIMPKEVASAFTQVASAKSELLKTDGALAKVTKQALLLANAAKISIPDAVRASVGALNQFNAGADQAARFVNVIAAGAKVGSSLVGETAEALKNAGSVAKAFNVSFEETNALIQVLAKNEIKGAEGGTKLRGVLLRLETASEGKFKPSILGIVGALEKMKEASLDNAQMAELFGAENITAGLALRSNIPLIKEWTKSLTGTNIAQLQAIENMSTFNSKVDGMKVKLAVISSAIFDKMLPGLNLMSAAGNIFLDSLNASDLETIGVILSGIGGALAIVGSLIAIVFTAALTIIKPFIAVLKGIGDIIGQVVAAIATLDFSNFDISESFNLGGKFLGLFGGDEESASPGTPEAPTTAPTVSPEVVTASANASLNGEIKVSAAEGSKVESVASQASVNGMKSPFNLGVGAAAGA